MELFEMPETEKVLWELAAAVKEDYKKRLTGSKHIASKTLVNSITQEVIVGDATYEVVLHLEDYWKYVENDTRGRQTGLPGRKDPPFDAIYKWVRVKRILPRPNDKGKIPTQRSLAWMIAHKIGEYGTKGSHDLEKTKDSIIPPYIERLQAAIGEDAIVYINRYITKVFPK